MNWPSRDRVISCVAVALPAVVMLAVGSVFWELQNFKGPDPDLWSPYVVPTLVGLLAGLAAGGIVRIAFPNEVECEELHLFFSILATIALAISFCLWWSDWAVRFAW